MAHTEPGDLSRPTPLLGDLLVNEGVLTRAELDKALDMQAREGGFLGQVLVQMGFVKQSDVSSCLVKQCKVPHLSLLDYNIEPDVSGLIPKEICLRHHLLPIDRLGKILTVAMVDPLDFQALEEVRRTCPDLRIKPILCNWQHYEMVCSRVYGIDARSKSSSGDLTMESLGLSAAPAKKPSPQPEQPSAAPPPNAYQPAPARTVQELPSVSIDATALADMIQRGVGQAMQEALAVLSVRMHSEAVHASSQGGVPLTAELLAQAMRDGVGGVLEETVAEAMVQFRALLGQQKSAADAVPIAMRDAFRSLLEEQRAQEEQRFAGLLKSLQETLREVAASVEQTPESIASESAEADTELDFRFEISAPPSWMTFSHFIGGKDNEFTVKLGEAAAREPGGKYNPVLVYGNVGVGKTHFLSAVGNRMFELRKDARVGLISAAQFAVTHEEALRAGRSDALRRHYAEWDMLLLDDIHVFEDRSPALEEFLHLMNVLHQRNKQIIISSDRPPDALGALGRQAVSRLSSGVVVELKPPTRQSRMEILQRASAKESVEVPDEVLRLISMQVPQDMRMMLGALSKVVAHGTLVGEPISYETAENVLRRLGAEAAA